MSKPSLVYAITLAVCVGGMWAILRAGSHLEPVADLAGPWRIDGGTLGPGGTVALGDGFVVEQSGRFLRVKFHGGQTLDLTAADPPMGAVAGKVPFKAAGGGSKLTGTLWPNGPTVAGSFVLTGPTPAQFSATKGPPRAAEESSH